MKNHFALAVLAFIGLSITQPAHALGQFSRACRFDSLPDISKWQLNSFFIEQGAPAALANLASRSTNEQALYWINESLTTDYFEVRYYLYAKSVLYSKNQPTLGDPNLYNSFEVYRSNWSVAQIKIGIRTDPRFSPAYVNRGPVPYYNARAGDPRIMKGYILLNAPPNTPVPVGFFKVVGRHSYYDPQSGSEVDLGTSSAKTCNIQNLGLGLFDW
jgi:hypothetical protein